MKSPFFGKLKSFTSKGKKFVRTATRWNKRYLRKRAKIMQMNAVSSSLSYSKGDFDQTRQYL